MLARSGGGLIAGAPLEQALQIWSFGEIEPGLERVQFAAGKYSERKFKLLTRFGREIDFPFPDPEQFARDRDQAGCGPAEDLFLVGRPW